LNSAALVYVHREQAEPPRDELHVLPLASPANARPHESATSCWCQPRLAFSDSAASFGTEVAPMVAEIAARRRTWPWRLLAWLRRPRLGQQTAQMLASYQEFGRVMAVRLNGTGRE
jgi:hypothetical protein